MGTRFINVQNKTPQIASYSYCFLVHTHPHGAYGGWGERKEREGERGRETVCILLSLPYICLKSNFMGQIFLENFSTAVRYGRYSLWKKTADCLFVNCLKRSWKRSALRESSFAVRKENFLQNVPLPLTRFFSKLLTWAFHNSAMMETKAIFWLLLQEVLSNWNLLFVVPCLTNACVSQLFSLEYKDMFNYSHSCNP